MFAVIGMLIIICYVDQNDARTSLSTTLLRRLHPNSQQKDSDPLITAFASPSNHRFWANHSEDRQTEDPSPPGPSVD